jgi:pyruvate,water dikinase
MVIKKNIDVSEKYVKWLSELSKESGSVAGGKGANLAEMFNSGFPVPPAFCITAQSFDIYLKKARLKQEIQEIIDATNVDDTTELEDNAKKIRDLIINSDMPDDMETEILEAYEILSTNQEVKQASQKPGISKSALDILKKSYEPIFVAVRSSATAEDLAAASFAGQQETYTNIKGNKQLIEAIKKCFASLYTARAVYYRHKKGFKEAEVLLSVVVQRMINSDKSGVVFTKNPMNNADEVIIESVFGLGEGIVSGKIRPDHYVVSIDLEITNKIVLEKKTAIVRESSGAEKVVTLVPEKSKQQVLSDSEIKNLANMALRIETHYGKPQDIEFSIESGKLYIVQSRPITTLGTELIAKTAELGTNFILSGLAASPGIVSGVVKIVHTMEDLSKIKNGDILVTKMTNPDMVVAMQRCSGIVTDEGGTTAHAAIVSREMGIPCVVGTDKATQILKDGMIITVDGANGKVYEGKIGGAESKKKEVMPILKGTRTKIKVMVDLPDFAERAAKSESDSVGLLRLEGIIANSGKHPLYFMKNKNVEEYTKIIEDGISKIAKHFKEVWIRTSDIRTDEYQHLEGAPKQVEVNPMLGFHGIRFSLKNLPLMEAEIEAIKRVAEKYPDKKLGIMFPQVISESEMADAFKIFKKYQRPNVVIGAMIETPAAVQVIRGICKYAKFISFGTNDLTQYTLAIDRGNSECQYMYDEMHPAVLSQLKRVIDICKEYHVQTSICGQAGSKKEMVEFLVRQGIDSLSVNADMASEISQYVKQLEDARNTTNKNPNNQGNNMDNKSKILPIDDLTEVEEKEEEKIEEVEKNKTKKKEQEEKEEVTSEEKKSEEYPEFEMGFDPFAEQK